MAAQLALEEGWTSTAGRRPHGRSAPRSVLCSACRAREARYGFRDEWNPVTDRPRALCFECFRVEIDRRHTQPTDLGNDAPVKIGAARDATVRQAALPLGKTLEALSRRRRRAQIAARHALAREPRRLGS